MAACSDPARTKEARETASMKSITARGLLRRFGRRTASTPLAARSASSVRDSWKCGTRIACGNVGRAGGAWISGSSNAVSPMGTPAPRRSTERVIGPRTLEISTRARAASLSPLSSRAPQPQKTTGCPAGGESGTKVSARQLPITRSIRVDTGISNSRSIRSSERRSP